MSRVVFSTLEHVKFPIVVVPYTTPVSSNLQSSTLWGQASVHKDKALGVMSELMQSALLAHGIAVVQKEVPPPSSNPPAGQVWGECCRKGSFRIQQ